MRWAGLCLTLLAICSFGLATQPPACPFKKAPQEKPNPGRGHNEPFGYHARQWRRIDTMYEHPSPEEFYEKYMRTSQPLVIRGGASQWPAIKKWRNLTYVGSNIDSHRAEINWKKMYDYDPFHPVRVRMRMDEFVKKFDEKNLYMDTTLPHKLAKDVHWPKSLGCRFYQKRLKQVAVMFNNGRSSSDYHMDATCTYFIQVTGKRRWLLTPPSHINFVYSGFPSLVDHTGISAVNQTKVDLEKHSLVKKLPIYGAVMNPGDIIYVPEGWHHQVKTYESPNIGVVAFLNYLMCDMHNDPNDDDIPHVKKCTGKILNERPKHLKCDVFKEDVLSIPDMLKKYPPPSPGNFAGSKSPDVVHMAATQRVMNNGKILDPMGIGFSENATLKQTYAVFKQGVLEGFRTFCVHPDNKNAMRTIAKMQKYKVASLKLLTYLPEAHFSDAGAFIDALLRDLHASKINILLLQTAPCPAKNGSAPCERHSFPPELVAAWRAMEAAKREGKVVTLGVSDLSLSELKALLAIAKEPVSIARARFDPWFRNHAYRRFCHKQKIAFMGRHVLGGQWAKDQPDLKDTRDIKKEYYILKAAFQYKISIHAVTYEFAMKKAVFVCPSVADELHVRVNAQSFRSMSGQLIDNLFDINGIDPTDQQNELFAPGAKNRIADDDDEDQPKDRYRVGKERYVSQSQWNSEVEEEQHTYEKSQKDFSNKEYSDEKDYEIFPSYLGVKDSNFKIES